MNRSRFSRGSCTYCRGCRSHPRRHYRDLIGVRTSAAGARWSSRCSPCTRARRSLDKEEAAVARAETERCNHCSWRTDHASISRPRSPKSRPLDRASASRRSVSCRPCYRSDRATATCRAGRGRRVWFVVGPRCDVARRLDVGDAIAVTACRACAAATARFPGCR